MDPSPADRSGSPQARLEGIGRVISVNGSQAAVELTARALREDNPAVAKFIGLKTQKAMIIGLITGVDEEPVHAAGGAGSVFRKVARLDLIGEFFSTDAGGVRFQRGFSEYPNIGDVALMLTENMLRLMYGTSEVGRAHIGNLQQNPNIQVQVDIDQLVSRHFAILGATGVGKSSGVVIILQKILETRPNLRIFLVDAHNEYGRCFGDQAHVLTPQNLHLPFWMFNFEEIVDVFFGGRPPVDEEVEVLAEVIPLAKAAYQYIRDGGDRHIVKKRGIRQNGFAPDTPVPYRIEDLVSLIDERMGKLENRSSRMTYHKLIRRIQTFRDHPRYTFMFENANVGGDTMADIVSGLFRLPTEGKPLTIMGLAGFPAEVVDAVVSVLCRMAFDFGVWSDGIAPLLFVCEEAHRYAPADRNIGFGPTRRALSRIAKEGRKYGVYLGLVTQRPAEIDSTILSQCSTLFVMRLSNEADQALVRAAVSEAAANLLSFVPSLATREVFTFGAGVALPTCMRFQELPRELRPNNDAAGITRSDASGNFDRDLVESVIGRWRSATMGFRLTDEDMQELGAPTDAPAPAPAVAPTVAPVSRPQTTPPLTGLRAEALRPSVLRKQLFES
jgi:DNA helicase HerA-like ATPase